METNNFKSMAVAGAGIALAAFLFVYLAHDLMTTEKVAPCSSRYPAATEFSFRADGDKPMSPIELQARAGANEWGVLERGEVVALADAPSSYVLQVQLPKGSTSMHPQDMPRGGLSFRWQPQDMDGAKSACLSYSAFIPADFKFGNGGELPGIFGGRNYQPARFAEADQGMSTHLKWGEEGKGDLIMQTPTTKGSKPPYHLDLGSFLLPRGRWFSVEQEVVLNAPDKADGIGRLWIDGALKVDRSKIVWRTSEVLTLTGAVHDVWYGGLVSTATAPADTALALTPMNLSWQR